MLRLLLASGKAPVRLLEAANAAKEIAASSAGVQSSYSPTFIGRNFSREIRRSIQQSKS